MKLEVINKLPKLTYLFTNNIS